MMKKPGGAKARSAAPESSGRTAFRWMKAGGPHISAVLLAAGSSSRFGGVKQLALIDGKTTLVGRAVAMLKRSKVESIVVVLGNRSEEVRERMGKLGTGVRVMANEEFRSGLSSSLKAGLMASPEDSDAIVVALADQPLVTSELIDEIVSRYLETGCPVVTASSGDLVSPPVLLDRSLYGDLLALEGDVGARQIILKHAPFERVEVERDALLDVDTQADIQRAREKLALLRGSPRTRSRRSPAVRARGRARPSSG